MAEKDKKVQEATPVANQKDVDENKIMAILSYFGLLVLIPLLAKKDSPFAQFHAKQGTVLLIACFAVGTISIVSTTIIAWIPVVGWIIGILISLAAMVAGIGLFVLAIMGIINAANGKMKELPVIGQYGKQINF